MLQESAHNRGSKSHKTKNILERNLLQIFPAHFSSSSWLRYLVIQFMKHLTFPVKWKLNSCDCNSSLSFDKTWIRRNTFLSFTIAISSKIKRLILLNLSKIFERCMYMVTKVLHKSTNFYYMFIFMLYHFCLGHMFHIYVIFFYIYLLYIYMYIIWILILLYISISILFDFKFLW